MSQPLVSVIMPAFNAAATLPTAVESVLAQSMGELELIVCDDASTDATAELLATISDPRVRYIRNPQNLGPGLSRDRAIKMATAHWVALIDADDAWLPERLEQLLAGVKGYPESIIFDDIMTCHSADGKLVPWRPVHGVAAFGGGGIAARDLRIEDYIGSPRLIIQPMMPVAVIRRHGLSHSSRSFGEDAEYFLRFALAGVGFRYLPEPLYLYRIQPGSATARAGVKQMRECIEACAKWEGWSDSVEEAFRRKIRALRHNETLYAIADHMRRGQLLSVVRKVISDPAVLSILPRRFLQYLSYQAHRLRYGGASRTSRKVNDD